MSEDNQLAATRAVLRQMMDASGVDDATQLARRAGIAHTTLTRLMSTKPIGDNPGVTWALSAKTWMKLSEASGVPVTFVGDRILASAQPGDRYVVQDPRQVRLLRFWDLLGPTEQELILSTADAWARRLADNSKVA